MMLGIKTKIINYYNKYLSSLKDFKKPLNRVESLILLNSFRKKIKEEANYVDLSLPVSKKTNQHASLTIKLLANYMPNNLGNWSIKEPYSLSTQLEKHIVEIFKNYYGCTEKIGGHFTSGSTEGNIYAAWIGRNYLMKKLKTNSTNKIVFLRNKLSHYSLSKAANLANISEEELAANDQSWNIDLIFLEETLEKLYQKGFRGFLLPLTVGYTVTGTEDDVEKICSIVEKLKKKYKEIEFFLWIDAAFSGISKVFTSKEKFSPFKNKNIELITTDFHKLLAVPYSSGLVLYKKSLVNFIKRNIPYIDQLDTTLLGSRSGINVIATWMTLKNLNERKLKTIFAKAIGRKQEFLNKISQEKLNLEIVTRQDSIQACLICKDTKSIEVLKNKYGLKEIDYKILFTNGYKKIKMIKIYFFPSY